MCMREQVHGLRMFLYGVIELIKNNKIETVSAVEEKLSTGIAEYLYSKHTDTFDSIGFNTDCIESIDVFYKNFAGEADGAEGKYVCEEKDGLYLILKLALNEIF